MVDGSDRFDVANRLFFRLYQCSNLLHKQGTRCVEAFGTTTQQWAVIGALARGPVVERGMTVKDLIAFLLLSRQNLTQVIDRLAERGWVERARDPADGRSRRVRLTAAGADVWRAMHAPIADFYAEALAGFDDAERLTLFRLLDRLKSGLAALER